MRNARFVVRPRALAVLKSKRIQNMGVAVVHVVAGALDERSQTTRKGIVAARRNRSGSPLTPTSSARACA